MTESIQSVRSVLRYCRSTRVTVCSVMATMFGIMNLAHAEPICIDFEGEVQRIWDDYGLLGGEVTVGNTVTGRYIYESTTPDTNYAQTVGHYRHFTSPFGITVNIGELVFRTDPNDVDFLVEIINDHGQTPSDNYLLRSYNNLFDISAPGDEYDSPDNHISWQLDDPTATAIVSIDLPSSPPILTNWEPLFGLQIVSEGFFSNFTIVSDVQAVKLCNATEFNLAPTANAGPDKSVRAGDSVQLDSSGSFDDNTPNSALIYEWSLYSTPIGSSATLSNDNSAISSLATDVTGEYVVHLTVTDEQGLSSEIDEVIISTSNLPPSAVAGADQLVISHSLVTLDASSSSDPEEDPISYLWDMKQAPSGSSAILNDNISPTPTFTPDLEGDYEISLTVSDPLGPGSTDTVIVTATIPEDYAETEVVNADKLMDSLPLEAVTSAGNQASMTDFLAQSVKALEREDIAKAIHSLERSISRVDGCVLRGAPDTKGQDRDWVTDCEAQFEVYETLTSALQALEQAL
ncbi:TPA: PKD domain-containing protein [Vibrio parahaemolyticus]|nr:PKD domain-containing protein [Vibrio parahaemolyticus]